MNSQMFKIKCDSFCCYAEDYQTALQSAVALLKAYGQRVIIFRPNEHTHFFTVDPDQSYEAVERALSAADRNLPPFC